MNTSPEEAVAQLVKVLPEVDSGTADDVQREYEGVKTAWGSTFLAQGNEDKMRGLVLANLQKYSIWSEFLHIDVGNRGRYAQITTVFGHSADSPEYALAIRVWKSGDALFVCGSSEFTQARTEEVQKEEAPGDLVACLQCCKLFNFRNAERECTDIGDWITCPHCGKQRFDNIHKDCPYWHSHTSSACHHDPSHPTGCSLQTKTPYSTCALL